MSDKLKKFVTEHKEEFDNSEPNDDLWSKIDAKLDVKDPSRISSNWLSKFKYLGFSVSILVIVIYVIASNVNGSASDQTKLEKKDKVTTSSANDQARDQQEFKKDQVEANAVKDMEVDPKKKNTQENSNGAFPNAKNESNHDTIRIKKETTQTFANLDPVATNDSRSDSLEESTNNSVKPSASKKIKFSVPADPLNANEYTGTLYTGADFCAMLRAYNFPGKVGLDMGSRKTTHNYKIIMTTTSCSRLARVTNMKAIWLKGKTSKKIMFSLMDGFKSIQLIKKDGKTVTPDAISHYYPGLLVISNYNGKFFNMAFEDKVDLILFFKDAQEGDKVVIDGAIEAYVKDQQ